MGAAYGLSGRASGDTVEPISERRAQPRLGRGGFGGAELARLHAEVARLKAELGTAERARELALDLVDAQEQRLADVRALADLAEWAAAADSGPGAQPSTEARVRVSDLRRALR